MQHLDEGLLMALLDGELTGAEQLEAETHLRACPDCASRLTELKSFMTEADGLVVALGEPPALETGTRPVDPVRREPRSRISPRALAWAASIVAAIGIGFAGSTLLVSGNLGSNISSRGIEQQDNSPAGAPVPPPTAAAPTEMAVQEESSPQQTGGGVATTPGPGDELRRYEADSASPRLTNEALAVRPNAAGEAGQSGISSADRDPAVAPARDTITSMADIAAKVAEREDRSQRSRAENRLAAPSGSSIAGLRQQAAPASPVFQQVTMEEAVRHLSGAIRLIDGLTPDEFEVSAADSAQPIVRVQYRVGPTESVLFLVQQRADNSFVASDLQRLESSVTRALTGNRLSWNDLRGFALTLSGPFSSDSLFHFKTLVK